MTYPHRHPTARPANSAAIRPAIQRALRWWCTRRRAAIVARRMLTADPKTSPGNGKPALVRGTVR